MNDIDRVLLDAGERWRSAQPNPPAIDAVRLVAHPTGRRPLFRMASMVTAIAAVVLVGLVAVQLGQAPGVGGTPQGGPNAVASPDEVGPSTGVAVSASPSATFTCDVTRPTDPLIPPAGYPSEPPPGYGTAWYGTPALWTNLDRDGETWAHLPTTPEGLAQKTFWWSTDWVPEAEPEPDITVVGTRLDAPGSFRADAATNAIAGTGTAMLVGVTVPSPGCWLLTGTYLDASLSIVVEVKGD